MIIEEKEYKQTITIHDFKTAMYVAKYNDYKHLMRLIGGIRYKENNKFDSMTFAINYEDDDDIIKLIFEYECLNFFEKNMERLFKKFVEKESDLFFKMNEERINAKYFNDDSVKNIEEIKEEIING